MNKGVGIGYNHWPVKSLPICLAQKCSCTYLASTNSWVNLLKDKIPFFYRYGSHCCSTGTSPKQLITNQGVFSYLLPQPFRFVLIVGYAPVLRWIINGVCQSEWTIMMSDDSCFSLVTQLHRWLWIMPCLCLVDGVPTWRTPRVSWPDSSQAWPIRWQLHFDLVGYEGTQGHWSCFLACGAPNNTSSSSHHGMTILCYLGWSPAMHRTMTLSHRTPSAMAI
jgi:hypothetical protein